MKNLEILKFEISKQKESLAFFEYLKQLKSKELLLRFVNLREGQVSLETINKFINSFYFKKIDLIKKNTEKTKTAWIGKQRFFLTEVSNIFNINYNKTVIAIPSIWPIFGRFFKNRFITFPYNKTTEDRLFVLAHELLHFIFYDYIYSKYGFSEQRMSSQDIWNFSEIVNALIQNQEKWIKEFKIKSVPCCTDIKLYKDIEREWHKSRDIDYLIRKFLLKNNI